MDGLVVPTISMVGIPVTFSFPTVEGLTQSDPSRCLLGSTTREERVPSLTTCRTAGVYTFGWCHQECCLHVLRSEEDGVSPER